jgi:hypothetical protein
MSSKFAHKLTHIQAVCTHTHKHPGIYKHKLIHRNMFTKPCFMMLRGQSRTSMHAGSHTHSIYQVPTHSKCSIMTHPCCRMQTMIHATLTKSCHMTSNKIHVTSTRTCCMTTKYDAYCVYMCVRVSNMQRRCSNEFYIHANKTRECMCLDLMRSTTLLDVVCLRKKPQSKPAV